MLARHVGGFLTTAKPPPGYHRIAGYSRTHLSVGRWSTAPTSLATQRSAGSVLRHWHRSSHTAHKLHRHHAAPRADHKSCRANAASRDIVHVCGKHEPPEPTVALLTTVECVCVCVANRSWPRRAGSGPGCILWAEQTTVCLHAASLPSRTYSAASHRRHARTHRFVDSSIPVIRCVASPNHNPDVFLG